MLLSNLSNNELNNTQNRNLSNFKQFA